jgi:hypothetical protein
MKRSWTILFAIAALAGCRSSQPTTNPFMRTTVAPPGTAAAVVTPGEPYYPGTPAPVAAPSITAPPPVVTSPTVVTPGAPIAPPPVVAPPPPVAPPVMMPPTNNRYSPPGGSYQYNQS